MILKGDALDLLTSNDERFDVVVTDPPYAFGGTGAEHEITSTVAVVLYECARRLNRDAWMVVATASSGRAQRYILDSVRGVKGIEWVRTGTWVKPSSRTKVKTTGWAWGSVPWLVFRKGRPDGAGNGELDWIQAPPLMNGRRAQLPPEVAEWAVSPFAIPGARFLDPFAGSGVLVAAAKRHSMVATGYDLNPPVEIAA